ncbi:hypothetical protein [Actinokineospora fastidiosa]|uniref:Mg chelatase-related protein C-terminal domain-containing protein n=1 Tax=Actinokineospora fastidiosa TaxID=1816 RepID=A0A918GPF9_9PSEU|nr:hypothetical protein GCM10010171_50810 [Actinokineospora fastidiosa]
MHTTASAVITQPPKSGPHHIRPTLTTQPCEAVLRPIRATAPALTRQTPETVPLPIPPGAVAMLDHALSARELTARGVDRCIRVAWVLADLAEAPDADQVAAALHFRDRLTLHATAPALATQTPEAGLHPIRGR